MLNWIFLFCAGCCEVVWSVGLKYSHSFTRIVPSCFVVGGMLASVALLTLAVRTLPIGTSYAVWTGIGSTGTAICGVLLFGEILTFWRVFFLATIVVGIVGLAAVSNSD